jgi:hypothetical protein
MVLTVAAVLTGGPRNPLTTTFPLAGELKDRTQMKISTKRPGLVVSSSIKVGGLIYNHNRQLLAR